MFEARLNKNSTATISAEDVYDENKIFYCLNPKCDAEFKLRSHHGVNRQHFYKFPGSKDHIDGCFYIDENNEKYFKDNVEAFNIEDIFYKTISTKEHTSYKKTSDQKPGNSISNNISEEKSFKTTINSSKALLKFCSGNSVETIINDNITINDIFIDHRNISQYYTGLNGLKMIYGTTSSFDKNNKSIRFTVI